MPLFKLRGRGHVHQGVAQIDPVGKFDLECVPATTFHEISTQNFGGFVPDALQENPEIGLENPLEAFQVKALEVAAVNPKEGVVGVLGLT